MPQKCARQNIQRNHDNLVEKKTITTTTNREQIKLNQARHLPFNIIQCNYKEQLKNKWYQKVYKEKSVLYIEMQTKENLQWKSKW